MEEVQNYNPQKLKKPPPLFTDVKYRNGALYLLTVKTLMRLNVGTGVIEANYEFHADGEGFERVVGRTLNFKTFTILDDGILILGPAFVWDHFLMSTQLPGYLQKRVTEKGNRKEN